MVTPHANNNSLGPGFHLSSTTLRLLVSSLSPASRVSYLRSWTQLQHFCTTNRLPFNFPCSLNVICNFIAHLFESSRAPSTIASHLSAISFVHKLANVPDPTQNFIVKKLLKGTQNLSKLIDSRLPITYNILARLIAALEHTVQPAFDRCMLKTLFTLAFHAFFRLGELAARSSYYQDKVLQREDIHFANPSQVHVRLRHSKHEKGNNAKTIILSASSHSELCPVSSLKTYLQKSKHSSGPLFVFASGQPVSHSYVSTALKHASEFIGLDSRLYKGHSFRIGAATEAAQNGIPENIIQDMGRWNSNAHRHYIRIQNFVR